MRRFCCRADRERAEHLRARADDHIIPDGRMALAHVLARSAEGHALIKRHIVAVTVVSPMTTPSPWSMKKPLPMHAPG